MTVKEVTEQQPTSIVVKEKESCVNHVTVISEEEEDPEEEESGDIDPNFKEFKKQFDQSIDTVCFIFFLLLFDFFMCVC